MDLWTDINCGADWGLDLLGQPNGPFGDLKETSHLKGDVDSACKPGEMVDQSDYSPQSEGHLDFEWMESGDLSSFLESLDSGEDRLSLQDGSSMVDGGTIVLVGSKDNYSSVVGGQQHIPYNSGGFHQLNEGLTPPESPEQVIPVIKLDSEINDQLWPQPALTSGPTPNLMFSVEDYKLVPEESCALIDSPVDVLGDPIDLKPELFGSVVDILGLPFTSDSGLPVELDNSDNTVGLSSDDCSSPSSPSESPIHRPSIDSLIQSSPELYKVIATPCELSARFSPYSKSKGDHKTKGGNKTKAKSGKDLPEPSSELFHNNLGKKERKKLQNKNAAIRYRQKKKAEVECIFTEVQGLEDRNEELKTKVDDLQREVKYMKSLMEDIYKAKGLVR